MAGPLEALFAGQMATQPSVLDRLMSETIVPRQPGREDAVTRMLGAPADWSGVATRGRDDTSMSPMNMAMGLIGGPSLRGIRAYHGSPHKFDKFSMDRIGTGEGAQAYGHGLYFAENEGVARSYRDALANPALLDPHTKAAQALQNYGSRDEAIRNLKQIVGLSNPHPQTDATRKAIELLEGGVALKPQHPGHMYEVNLRANPEQFLDWDRPLPTYSPVASRVHDASRAILDRPGGFGGPRNDAKDTLIALDRGHLTGQGAYHALARGQSKLGNLPNPGAANQALLAEGIPGIKYLDQGSRSAGQGSSNYVVFDDSIIDILKRYGIMGGAVSPLATLMQENPQ
jgi:hypothetical protein